MQCTINTSVCVYSSTSYTVTGDLMLIAVEDTESYGKNPEAECQWYIAHITYHKFLVACVNKYIFIFWFLYSCTY